jgi:hypothetical protein
MMKNQDAWRELVRVLDTHQKDFNEQLGRLKAKELDAKPDSPLLGPIKQYSESVPYASICLNNRKLTHLSQNAGGNTSRHHERGWAGRYECPCRRRMEESETPLLKIRQRKLRARSGSSVFWSAIGRYE